MKRRDGIPALRALALTCTLVAASPPLPAAAAAATVATPHQPLASILDAAARATRDALPGADSRVELLPGGLDERLRLPSCPRLAAEPVQMPTSNVRRLLVRVRCASGPAWTVNVPVEVWTRGPVLVARRDLRRGEIPVADHFEIVTRRVPGMPASLVADARDLAGWQLRRPVAAGSTLEFDALERQPVIRRGQQVTLLSQPGRIEVRAPGIALADARPGERVRAQNVNSLKVVEGRADNGDVVRIE